MFQPPPQLTVAEWAELNRKLSSKTASPGPWSNHVAPYQVEPMNCGADSVVRMLTLMWAAQTGKTDGVLGNIIGYHIEHDPQGCIFMHPNDQDARDWSRQKLEPMISESPCLATRVAPPRARDKSSTILRKEFPGGFIMAIGSNSPKNLRGRSAPLICEDEIDGYILGPEGDPGELLWRRANTFPSRRRIRTSTPTLKGHSRVEAAFEDSDKRFYWVPCPDCGHFQKLAWAQVKWDQDDDGNHLPASARYECEACGFEIKDRHKPDMLRRGKWIAEKPFQGHAGFHLNGIYSPWLTFQDLVENFLRAKHTHDLQSFINTDLAETWEEPGTGLPATDVQQRSESWELAEGVEVPEGGVVLTIGVDLQGGPPARVEYEVVAWGRGEESWSIQYGVILGDPERDPTVLQELDAVLTRPWMHQRGVELFIRAACIDSGFAAQTVYEFCKPRLRRPTRDGRPQFVFAVKGRAEPFGQRRPVWTEKPGKTRKMPGVLVWTVGVDAAKSKVYARLGASEPGPGYCHFPEGRPDSYFEGLTAEREVVHYHKGRPYRSWELIRKRIANEPLDCRVYSYAGIGALQAKPFLLSLDAEADRIEAIDPRTPVSTKGDGDSPGRVATKPPANSRRGRRVRSTGYTG